jgi:hypothetical protein
LRKSASGRSRGAQRLTVPNRVRLASSLAAALLRPCWTAFLNSLLFLSPGSVDNPVNKSRFAA